MTKTQKTGLSVKTGLADCGGISQGIHLPELKRHPDVKLQALHKFIQAEELGQLFFIKAGWLQAYHKSIRQPWLLNTPVSGGGVVPDLGVQMIDLIWSLPGKPAAGSVKSFTCQINPGLSLEDFCSVCVNFADNLMLSLEISWNFPIARDRFYLEITGQEGVVTLDPWRLQKIMHGQVINLIPEIRESKISSFKMAYQIEVYHSLDYFAGRTGQPESGIEHALEIPRIVDAIYESIKNQREIHLQAYRVNRYVYKNRKKIGHRWTVMN
jgi:predicted dehydrogenase